MNELPEETVRAIASLLQGSSEEDLLDNEIARAMLVLDAEANENGLDSDERYRIVGAIAAFMLTASSDKQTYAADYVTKVAGILKDVIPQVAKSLRKE